MPQSIRPSQDFDFGTCQLSNAVVQFRILDLLAATTLAAAVFAYIRYWNTAYETYGGV